MLPNSRVIKVGSVLIGGLPSLFLSYLLCGLFVATLLLDEIFHLGFAFVALLGLYGSVAVWQAIFDVDISNHGGRRFAIAGIAAGIFAAAFAYIRHTSLFSAPDYLLELSIIGSVAVGAYHLVRLIQYEVGSRTPQT